MSVTIDRALYARLLRLLGDDHIMLLPFWDATLAAGDPVADIGQYSYSFAMGAAAFDDGPFLRGTTLAYDFSGLAPANDEYLIRADTLDFSFISGGVDAPFSLIAWCNMVDMTESVIMSKYDSAAATNLEWDFGFDGADKLYLDLHDDSVPADGGRISAALTAQQNEWGMAACSYDGVGGDGAGGLDEAGGIDLYWFTLDGAVVYDVGDMGAGNYVDMENKAAPIYIGCREAAALEWQFDGRMCLPMATRQELSATALRRIFEVTREILCL